MKAIFKRELKAYFASPVGYVVVAALLALYGFFYYQVMMIGSSSYISQVFGTMFTFCMMIIPIITMRSMSDERKNKTDFATAFPWGIMIGNFIGTLLYGAAMIAIGVFISSLTISQVIAAIGTFAISVFLMFIDQIASALSGNILGTIISWISFTARYDIFTQGVFSISSCVYFISVSAVFVFLTARKVESRRWN